jgi:hypothetical protein
MVVAIKLFDADEEAKPFERLEPSERQHLVEVLIRRYTEEGWDGVSLTVPSFMVQAEAFLTLRHERLWERA